MANRHMAISEQTANPSKARALEMDALTRFFRSTELDTRMLGMLAALLLIWIGFHYLSGERFITPRNLWNLSVQTASVAVMATGMVLVIVTRNIDLSVGSVLGFVAVLMGVLQVDVLPQYLGLGHPLTWAVTLAAGLLVGGLIGGFHGFIIAYLGVPAFIVTLGGLLAWRGLAWWLNSGQTISPLDPTFRLMGGGPAGSIGEMWSWIVGGIVCLAIAGLVLNNRRQRGRFGFPQRPVWAEFVISFLGFAVALGAVAVANAYYWPRGVVKRYAEANGIATPIEDIVISHGLAIPVLIAIGAGVIMTFLATRTRFGRYIYAMGGNPEAADLAGIKTRWVTMKIFILMGMLCAVSAAISTARLNAATNAQGTLDELLVIAAAVIGGTSLGGGIGTIAGAMLGALVMQSLQSGMVLLGVDAPLQNVVVGAVLVVAVYLDGLYRRAQT